MKKFSIIIPYFGKLPNYFQLFLKTCENNKEVDFLIFTDDKKQLEIPNNVKIISMTLSEMKALAERKLGMDISLEKPYKCCDFKVSYGVIFSDYLKEYEYWGYSDMDLMLGDMSYFFEKYSLEDYDKFLTLGHLSIYRNDEDVNNRFKLSGSNCGEYIEVFKSSDIFAFDEMNGIYEIYKKNGFSCYLGKIFIDISPDHKRFIAVKKSLLGGTIKNYDKQIFAWINGKVYWYYVRDGKLEREEYLYIHFQKRPNFKLDFDPKEVNSFYITNKGFIPFNGEVTISDIDKYNEFKGEFSEKVEDIKRIINIRKRYLKYHIEHIFK